MGAGGVVWELRRLKGVLIVVYGRVVVLNRGGNEWQMVAQRMVGVCSRNALGFAVMRMRRIRRTCETW